jgi:hypothetical protein
MMTLTSDWVLLPLPGPGSGGKSPDHLVERIAELAATVSASTQERLTAAEAELAALQKIEALASLSPMSKAAQTPGDNGAQQAACLLPCACVPAHPAPWYRHLHPTPRKAIYYTIPSLC